ncbi:ATP-binding cassette domain-containing protein, partial [Ralstonia pseudosolanacearum]|uniref:ATP-binding cassette domain-containing protein n=1 Tax=Ralstonia pseudosolanacearum TaxID=1310165 RepID=UPI003D27B6B9
GGMELRAGSVSLDGVPLERLDPADLRRDTCLLPQHARLFHGSLRDNLSLGSPLADDASMRAALAMVGAGELLAQLRDELDHPILEGGLGLSAGQRQAVLLARLMLRRPTIALLDEPTSSLDTATEERLVRTLAEWGRDRTLVFATHRPALVALADRIIVVDDGRIVLDQPRESAISILSAPGGLKVSSGGAHLHA